MVLADFRVERAMLVGMMSIALLSPVAASAIQVTMVPAVDDRGTPVGNPELFSLHLDPFDPTLGPSVFMCGEPIELPEGAFYAWIEGPNRISERFVIHGPGPDAGGPSHHEFRYKVGPAGTVMMSSSDLMSYPADAEVRLLSVSAHRSEEIYRNEFARTLSVGEAGAGVQMPAGPVIAAVVDPGNRRYLNISRPQVVSEGLTTVVVLEKPEDCHLVVRLERFEPMPNAHYDDVTVRLRAPSGESRKPDIQVPAMARVYSFWYDLDPGTAIVEVESGESWMPDTNLNLEAGEVTNFAGSLRARATLDGALLLPDDLNGQPTTITVRAGDDVVAVKDVEPAFPAEFALIGLPPTRVAVEVFVGPWRFEGDVDLSPGNGRLVLAPEVARVHGQVTVGGDPAVAAVVGFLTNRSSREEEVVAKFPTDEYGEFTAVVFPAQVQPMTLVSIDDREPIWWWIEKMPLRDGDRIDIVLEGRALDVRVLDAVTGRGIAGAAVTYGWEGTGGGGRQTASDDDGLVSLPPVPADQLKIFVRAVGYRQVQKTIVMNSPETEGEIQISLDQEPTGDLITVLLDNGSPAAGAEVALIPSVNAVPRSVKQTDADGTFLVEPGGPNEILAIRHPQSGAFLGRLGKIADTREIRLPSRAGPLKVRIVEPSGAPVPYARIAVWLDGLRLQGGFLAWLTGGSDAADRAGEWVGQHLPARPIEILAWQLSQDADHMLALQNGEMDYRRQSLLPPWGAPATVEAVLR